MSPFCSMWIEWWPKSPSSVSSVFREPKCITKSPIHLVIVILFGSEFAKPKKIARWAILISWLRGKDLNLRPPGYEETNTIFVTCCKMVFWPVSFENSKAEILFHSLPCAPIISCHQLLVDILLILLFIDYPCATFVSSRITTTCV